MQWRYGKKDIQPYPGRSATIFLVTEVSRGHITDETSGDG